MISLKKLMFEETPVQPQLTAGGSPSPSGAVDYNLNSDFSNFETKIASATEQYKAAFLRNLNSRVLGKKVSIQASKGYGQPIREYTISVTSTSLDYFYDRYIVILKDENDKEYFLKTGFKITIIGVGEPLKPKKQKQPKAPSAEPAAPKPAAPTQTPQQPPAQQKPLNEAKDPTGEIDFTLGAKAANAIESAMKQKGHSLPDRYAGDWDRNEHCWYDDDRQCIYIFSGIVKITWGRGDKLESEKLSEYPYNVISVANAALKPLGLKIKTVLNRHQTKGDRDFPDYVWMLHKVFSLEKI